MKIKLIKEIDNRVLNKTNLDTPLYLEKAKENMKDIFGDNWRIIIPMVAPVDDGNLDSKNRDEMMLRYISEVETKTGYKVDFSQPFGLAYKDVESTHNGKTFTTRRKLKLGPLIRDLWPGAAEFWDKNNKFYTTKENALYFQERSQFVIVLTRHPIDVVRMSDHEGITSCHRVGGDYFKCAVAEARNGGAVAYVIRKEDLEEKQVTSRGKMRPAPDLQGKDFFYDEDRGVGDVVPIARLRIRQVRNIRAKMKLAIPENKIYGRNMILLATQVKNFLLEKQKDKINSLKNTEVNTGDFVLLGGSYQDTAVNDLINDFLDGIDSIKIESFNDVMEPDDEDDEDFSDEPEPSFYERAQEFINDNYSPYPQAFRHFFLGRFEEDDGSMSATARFYFAVDMHLKGEIKYKEEREIKNIFRDIFDISGSTNIELDVLEGDFLFRLNDNFYDMDDFERFLNMLIENYNNFDDKRIEFRTELAKRKLIGGSIISSMYNFKPKNLESYTVEEDEDEIQIKFQKIAFIELQKIIENYSAYRTKFIALNCVEKYNEKLQAYIKNFINSYKENDLQQEPAQQKLNLDESAIDINKRQFQSKFNEAKQTIAIAVEYDFGDGYDDNNFLNYIFSITIEVGELTDYAIRMALITVNMIDRNINKFKQEAEKYLINEIENDMMTIK